MSLRSKPNSIFTLLQRNSTLPRIILAFSLLLNTILIYNSIQLSNNDENSHDEAKHLITQNCHPPFCIRYQNRTATFKLMSDLDVFFRFHEIDYFILETNPIDREFADTHFRVAVNRDQWNMVHFPDWKSKRRLSTIFLSRDLALVQDFNQTAFTYIVFYDQEKEKKENLFFLGSTDQPLSFTHSEVFPLKRTSFHGYMFQIASRPCTLSRVVLSAVFPYDQISWKDEECTILDRQNTKKTGVSKIPKIIHTVWVGKKKSPPYDAMKTCKDLHPDWTYMFWHDDILDKRPFSMRPMVDIYDQLNGKADIYRWELLHTFGGVWIDADTRCFRSLNEVLSEDVSLFANFHCLANPWATTCEYSTLLANSIVGSSPDHLIPFMIMRYINKTLPDQTDKLAWKTVGNLRITEAFWSMNKYDLSQFKVGMYPFYYFVPHEWRDTVHTDEKSIEKLVTKTGLKPYATNEWGETNHKYESGWQEIPSEFKLNLGGKTIDEFLFEKRLN